MKHVLEIILNFNMSYFFNFLIACMLIIFFPQAYLPVGQKKFYHILNRDLPVPNFPKCLDPPQLLAPGHTHAVLLVGTVCDVGVHLVVVVVVVVVVPVVVIVVDVVDHVHHSIH